MTVGIVGIGRWGKNLLRCFDECATVAYCVHTGDTSNAAWVRERYPDLTVTEQFERVLDDDSVDAVVIATPVATHAALAKQAITHGKDVFVEKPIADDVTSAKEVTRLAADHDCRLFTGYIFLYTAGMRALRSKLDDDPPQHVMASWDKFGTFGAPVAWNLACHDVAVGHYLFDEQFERATEIGTAGVRTDCDLLTAVFETGDGRQLVASYDRTANRNSKSIVVVTRSGARYEFFDDTLLVLEGDDNRTVVGSNDTEPLESECSAFVEWVDGGSKPPSGGRFGAAVTEVLCKL